MARALSKRLRRAMPLYPEPALETDVRALAAVHRQRKDAVPNSLPKCKAVLVTRNYPLYEVSRKFFEGREGSPVIPVCIPMSAFTTMVWVREPLSAPKLPEDRVLAHAYTAMNFDQEDEWREVNEQAVALRREGNASEADAHRLRVRAESRHALSEDERGSETQGDQREPYVEESPEQIRKQRDEDARGDELRRQKRAECIAKRAGETVARALFFAIIPLLCLGIVVGPLGILDGSGSPVPRPLQIVGAVVLAVLTVVSIYDGASLGRRVQWTAARVERGVLRLCLRLFS
jgi:hypothetical protein